ncbi:Holliday junction resolvase RuvX [Paludibacterium denitrificans]|uniref:Putative pre-16S rRNA nuclease n=1 Tax=Paludibacterium denitrificans TaxID=2675226 RepID=A0A844GDR2_9NEIS|nr:Holliday junction resolvase RuvX [Paludibacterium denitrificans]MTD32884.1 Holliday junction resolvase RuvX [Paludibacterium denitrificans]
MREGTALAFDFGERRIGVAVGESLLGIAHPLVTIDSNVNDERFAIISQLIDEWHPTDLVVGLPMHGDGTEHAMTQLARRFANRLKGRYRLPVWLVDERLTSVEAEAMLNEVGLRGRKQKPALDQVAARAILTTWFEAPGTAV